MANAAAFIDEGLWRKDREFQQLSRLAQCTFCQVLSQKDLDTAGVLTLHLDLLAKACHELTVEQLKSDLAELEQRRFLFVDYDTDELLIRSYVRRVSALPRNNGWRSVPKNARMIASEKLRHELATELRRIRRADATELADEIDPLPTPSGPPLGPLGKGSGRGTPSGPPSDPPSQVQVPVPVSPTVGGSVGEPSPFCPHHPNGTDKACFACGQARRSYAERQSLWDEQRARIADAAKQAELDCLHCDDAGWLIDEATGEIVEPAVKCTHQEVING